MDDKLRVETLLKLADQSYADYRDRCALEWRVHLSLWSLLVAFGVAALGHPKAFGGAALIILAAIPLHIVWEMKMLTSHFRRQTQAREYQIAAAHLIGLNALREHIAPELEAATELQRWKFPEAVEARFKSPWLWMLVIIGTTILIVTTDLIIVVMGSLARAP